MEEDDSHVLVPLASRDRLVIAHNPSFQCLLIWSENKGIEKLPCSYVCSTTPMQTL